jgi:hypothetical protein
MFEKTEGWRRRAAGVSSCFFAHSTHPALAAVAVGLFAAYILISNLDLYEIETSNI